MSTSTLLILLLILILLSTFFSCAETAMMAVNRYRLRHLARKGHIAAKRVSKLLERPDKIISVILIGDTFADVASAAVATVLAISLFGEASIFPVTILLTLIILVFGEIAPKTFAVLRPERVAFAIALPLKIILKVLSPIVWVSNGVSRGLLRLLGIKVDKPFVEPLTVEELRTVVHEAAGKISPQYHNMLLRILDFERVTVEDLMIPRQEIEGIDIEKDWEEIFQKLTASKFSSLPLYRETIDDVIGMLTLRKILALMQHQKLTKEDLIKLMDEVYYIPAGAKLSHQLLNFHSQEKDIGLVVDEYGEIQGLLTVEDVLTEIVGEVAQDLQDFSELIKRQEDGSIKVDGSVNLRDLNRVMNWHLPTEGPKTLSGLIIEHLEMIPDLPVCLAIGEYRMEVRKASRKRVQLVQIWVGKHV